MITQPKVHTFREDLFFSVKLFRRKIAYRNFSIFIMIKIYSSLQKIQVSKVHCIKSVFKSANEQNLGPSITQLSINLCQLYSAAGQDNPKGASWLIAPLIYSFIYFSKYTHFNSNRDPCFSQCCNLHFKFWTGTAYLAGSMNS